jgi:copper chaperone CopZ
MNELVLSVPGISCGHCVNAITAEVGAVPGVTAVQVDLACQTVRVTGEADETAVRRAVHEAGYDAV